MAAAGELKTKRSLWQWVRAATISGIAASVLVHVIAAIIALLVTVTYKTADAGGEGAGVVDFAVMSEAELASMSDAAASLASTHVPDAAVPSLTDLELSVDASIGDIDALTSELMDVDIAAGGGDLSSGSLEAAGGGMSGAGASFFGLEAKGSRFAYIVDVSGSMSSEGRIDRMKSELSRSVAELADTAEVAVVLFSSGASPLMGQLEWTRTDRAGKTRLRHRIGQIEPAGGTEPLEAFRMVLSMDPAPDAVYFMTDGEFAEAIPGDVRSLNRRNRVPIHSIMFGNFDNPQARSRVEAMMRQIARDSGGGRFRHVGDSP